VSGPTARTAEDHGSRSAQLLYKPFGITSGVLGGLLANAVFGAVWKKVTHDDDRPTATDQHRDLGEVLAAAALQGLVFAVVRAAIDRGGARLFFKWTGEWPG